MKITLKFVQIQFQSWKTLQKCANQVAEFHIHVSRHFWRSETQNSDQAISEKVVENRISLQMSKFQLNLNFE